jgi:hypothetical protein
MHAVIIVVSIAVTPEWVAGDEYSITLGFGRLPCNRARELGCMHSPIHADGERWGCFCAHAGHAQREPPGGAPGCAGADADVAVVPLCWSSDGAAVAEGGDAG